MKLRIYFLTVGVAFMAALWAQAPATRQPTTRPAAPPRAPARPGAPGGNPTQPTSPPGTTGQPAPVQPNNGSTNNNQNAQIAGFDGVAWGTTYKDMKERFRVMASSANANDNVEIISDNPDREILIRRREIYYRYVFYKKPADKPVASMPKPSAGKTIEKPAQEEDATAGTAKFFFVESIFPLLKEDELYKTLTQKYGQRTGSSVGEAMRGAYTWDTPEGFLVQWVEPYQKHGYTRSLYYLSRKIRDEIKNDLQAWQFVREIKALDALFK
ncbi:MAG: hypothetical protein LDLANPLL_01591 [Turneriella sp.]|nr:hypothetical protein [Turneriella sp.]